MARSCFATGEARRRPALSSSTPPAGRECRHATVTIGLYGARADSHHAGHMQGISANPLRARGFNVVEMLVALLVIAVGIVGVAALYSDQTHIPPDTRFPLRAAELAEGMAERIRLTEEGRDGFATTVGVICDRAKKLKT